MKRGLWRKATAALKRDLGVAKPIVHTEFGYGLNQPGHCVLDQLLNGAVHGAFHVSRIIAAINDPGSFAAITLESFVGWTPAAGPRIPVDPQAGNRSDYWCGLAASTVPMFESNRPDLAQVAGTAQLFAHFASTAGFRSEAPEMWMHPIDITGGPALGFAILGELGQPCLQAAAFSNSPVVAAEEATQISLNVLNICDRAITVSTAAATGARANLTIYSLLDPGPVDPGPLGQRGWGPLPADPNVMPWPDGPLTPDHATFAAGHGGEIELKIPGLVFAVVEIR